jgi:hypothetical protein
MLYSWTPQQLMTVIEKKIQSLSFSTQLFSTMVCKKKCVPNVTYSSTEY